MPSLNEPTGSKDLLELDDDSLLRRLESALNDSFDSPDSIEHSLLAEFGPGVIDSMMAVCRALRGLDPPASASIWTYPLMFFTRELLVKSNVERFIQLPDTSRGVFYRRYGHNRSDTIDAILNIFYLTDKSPLEPYCNGISSLEELDTGTSLFYGHSDTERGSKEFRVQLFEYLKYRRGLDHGTEIDDEEFVSIVYKLRNAFEDNDLKEILQRIREEEQSCSVNNILKLAYSWENVRQYPIEWAVSVAPEIQRMGT